MLGGCIAIARTFLTGDGNDVNVIPYGFDCISDRLEIIEYEAYPVVLVQLFLAAVRSNDLVRVAVHRTVCFRLMCPNVSLQSFCIVATGFISELLFETAVLGWRYQRRWAWVRITH